jgi:hypothetical protein
MHRSTPRFLAGVIAVTALLLVSSCASVRKTAAAGEERKIVLTESEYETVYVTGSMLPVLVPKSATARPLPSMSPVSTMSAEAYQKAMQPGRSTVNRR